MSVAEALLALETARAETYVGLADAFRPPSSNLTASLETLAAALERQDSAAAEASVGLPDAFREAEAAGDLAVDYAALFLGPFLAPAPPYGSVYLEARRRLMGDSTLDVRRRYRDLGLDIAPDFREAPDHVVPELEFMNALIRKGVAAIEAEDPPLLAQIVHLQRDFLETHLAAWTPPFCDAIIAHARTFAYRLLARTTRTFVAEDLLSTRNAAQTPETAAFLSVE